MKNLQLGKVLMTAGIASYIDEANFHKEVMDDLKRHTSGDWGCLSEEDKLANDNALNNNERILSAYDTCHGSIWIITEWTLTQKHLNHMRLIFLTKIGSQN